jgi:hypothetical protein
VPELIYRPVIAMATGGAVLAALQRGELLGVFPEAELTAITRRRRGASGSATS